MTPIRTTPRRSSSSTPHLAWRPATPSPRPRPVTQVMRGTRGLGPWSAAAHGLLDASGAAAGLAFAPLHLAAAVAVGAEVGRGFVALGGRLVAGRVLGFARIAHAPGLPA